MTRILLTLALLLLPAAALSGCLQPDPDDSNLRPRYGLGLDTTNPPPRGDFIEPAADVERFAQFLSTWGPDMLEECDGSRNDEGFHSLMDEKWYLNALDAVIGWCEDYLGRNNEPRVRQDYSIGREIETINHIMLENNRVINETINVVSELPIAANAVDVEVIGFIMRHMNWIKSSFQTGMEIYESYNPNRSTHDPYTIYTVMDIYENLSNPSQAKPVIMDFIENYPWWDEGCQANPDEVEKIFEETNTLLTKVIAKAEGLRSPDEDDMHLGTNYGRLILDYTPSIAFFEKNGWWPATLRSQALLEWSDSGWDHHNDEVLPTQEEAIYLVEVYLNQSRSLITDEQVSILIGNLPYRDFEREPFWAIVVLSLPEFRWPYGNLPCQ